MAATVSSAITEKQLDSLTQEISVCLSQKLGFRLGEATVVSLYCQRANQHKPGEIQLLVDRDVGQQLLGLAEAGRVIQAKVYHATGRVHLLDLNQALCSTIARAQPNAPVDLYTRLWISQGPRRYRIWDLLNLPEGSSPPVSGARSHVELLLQDFTGEELHLLPLLVDGVEQELAKQGIEIRKVERIIHLSRPVEEASIDHSDLLKPDRQQLWRQALNLSIALSSPEDAREFLQAFQPGLFKRKQPLANLRSKHGSLQEFTTALYNAGLLKKGLLSDTLTKDGQKLLEFISCHQRELESQLRKIMRAVPIPRSPYRSIRQTRFKSRQKLYSRSSKTTVPMKNTWLGNIAIPETLVRAARRRLVEERPFLEIQRKDIVVYQQEGTTPVDVCLLIDGSGSMAGAKMRAVWRLAEHLLLTTKDKVSVVVFQELSARVVVPFTRNYTRLKQGLRSIQPRGMTPLAAGLEEAVKLIKNRQVHNPLVVLITDGEPTCSKWVISPREDALKAAEGFRETRAHVICIGIDANRDFLESLAEHANFSLYIVNNLEEGATLIDIVKKERRVLGEGSPR